MRIVVVGATGVVGGAVHGLLSQERDLIAASRNGEHQVDMQSPDSITLTTGILNREPVPGTAVAATVNGGLEAFVQAAATELPRGIRINAVSANVLEETKQAAGPSFFAGYQPVPADRVALAYQKSIANRHTGRIYGVWQ